MIEVTLYRHLEEIKDVDEADDLNKKNNAGKIKAFEPKVLERNENTEGNVSDDLNEDGSVTTDFPSESEDIPSDSTESSEENRIDRIDPSVTTAGSWGPFNIGNSEVTPNRDLSENGDPEEFQNNSTADTDLIDSKRKESENSYEDTPESKTGADSYETEDIEEDDIDEAEDLNKDDSKSELNILTTKDAGFEKTNKITTINENLEGEVYPGTDVKFERKTVLVDGKKAEGVFPQFDSKADIYLPKDMRRDSDTKQFQYCTKALSVRLDANPSLAKMFSSRQLEMIKNGEPRISGLTWHHSEVSGKMQLVDAKTHSVVRHTGGRIIWGGGSNYR